MWQKTLEASLKLAHALCSILFLYSIGFGLLFGQTKPEKINVSCIATNHPFDVVNAQTKKNEEVEDWRVSCTIAQGDKVVWSKPLILPYPEPYTDAMTAINEFRKKGYAEILKQLKNEKEKQ